MSKFRKHSIEEKRKRSKVRKERKKLARKNSESGRGTEERVEREPLVSTQNQPAETGEIRCQDGMGYSRKNPHPPDGWHDFFDPPPSTRISGTTRPPLLPGFPSPKTPPPTRISINFFRGLNFNRNSMERT